MRGGIPTFSICLAGLAMLAGCATARRAAVPETLPPAAAAVPEAEARRPEPVRPEAPVDIAPDPAVERPPAEPAPPAPAGLASGEYVMRIESEPAGALIIVNNVPQGKAPLELVIRGTPQGFSREYVEIEARFLARDPSEVSSTKEVELTPLERVPAVLKFTPSDVQRQLK